MSGFASHLFAVVVGAVIGFTGAMWIREKPAQPADESDSHWVG